MEFKIALLYILYFAIIIFLTSFDKHFYKPIVLVVHMHKKIFGIILLLVMAIQILPVKQVGFLLCSNQLTEDLPLNADLEKDFIKKMDGKSNFLETGFYAIAHPSSDIIYAFLMYSDLIPLNHSSEIHTPPPNC